MPAHQHARRIDHVVVLMLENRSFDHVFGFFEPGPGESITNLRSSSLTNRFDPAKPVSPSNPAVAATSPAPFAVHDKEGPPHGFASVCLQLCNDSHGPGPGRPVNNEGFVRAYKDDLLRRTHVVDQAKVAEVMTSFAPAQLPAINDLATNFCVCDHWFCDVPSSTMSNRMFVHAATSEGYVHNAFDRPYHSKTIYELVEEKGLSWATYFHDLNEVLQFSRLSRTPEHFRRFVDRFADDVLHDRLPNYSFILPRFMNRSASELANSQHLPEDVRHGEHLIADVYDALVAAPEVWQRTALIVTYDEHGGFFDHVAPGATVNPDGQNSPNPDDRRPGPPFSFDRLGLRVPAVIASPWIPRGRVEHRTLQHASVIKSLTEIFDLAGPLNQRDAHAASFADLFEQMPAPRPASDMPARLARPSATAASARVASMVAGVPLGAEEEPLDPLTEEWVRGFAALTAGTAKSGVAPLVATAAMAMPMNHAQAADLVQQRLAALGI